MTENNLPEPTSVGEGLIKGGAALVRFQDDTMMGLALQRPRDVAIVRDDVLAEITAFPEYADRYFYSIPHRTPACGGHPTSKICPNCALVEGPSIHAALAIQRAWGNSFSSWMPGEETSESLWIDGVFVDYERNVKWVRPVRFEKGYTKRDGTWVPLKGEKLVKAMNAAGSKAQRNAILAGVPDALKIMAFTKAKELVVGDDPGAPLKQKHVDAIVVEFARLEVSLELLESKLGRPVAEWVMRDRATLLGLRTALVEGEAREGLFGSTVRETQAKPVANREPISTPTREPLQTQTREPIGAPEPLSAEELEKFRQYQALKKSAPTEEGMATHEQSDLIETEDLPLEGTQEAEPPEKDPVVEVIEQKLKIEPKEDLKKKPEPKTPKEAMQGVTLPPKPKAAAEPDPFTANLFED